MWLRILEVALLIILVSAVIAAIEELFDKSAQARQRKDEHGPDSPTEHRHAGLGLLNGRKTT